jgi:hypothetical protein
MVLHEMLFVVIARSGATKQSVLRATKDLEAVSREMQIGFGCEKEAVMSSRHRGFTLR